MPEDGGCDKNPLYGNHAWQTCISLLGFAIGHHGVPTMQVRARRSVLYMPGSNARALEKARTIAADALILDLEDSVAPDAKEESRKLVLTALQQGGYGRREVVVRVNGLDTPWGAEDLAAAARSSADGILIPKVSRPEDIVKAASMIKSARGEKSFVLWAMMETPTAILNAREIAAAKAEVSFLDCLVMGTNDLLKETRARSLGERIAIVPWLAMTILAARAHGIDIIDGVYNDFRNEAGFLTECEQGRTLGMDGKTLIHPSQVEPCNSVFSSTSEEIGWARKVIAAFQEPQNANRGVITVEGRMVERLHLAMAERAVAIAEAIAERDVAS